MLSEAFCTCAYEVTGLTFSAPVPAEVLIIRLLPIISFFDCFLYGSVFKKRYISFTIHHALKRTLVASIFSFVLISRAFVSPSAYA